MENTEDVYMDYLNNTQEEAYQMLRGSGYGYEATRELESSSSNSTSLEDSNWFSITDEQFTGLFVIMPIGVAALAGAVAGAVTHVSDDTFNSYTNYFISACRSVTFSPDDTKLAINRVCRMVTFMDVIGSSIGSIFYGSGSQITVAQHTVTAIWVWTGVPAAFVAAENLMKPIYRAP